MDRGAARSRKRSQADNKPTHTSQAGPSNPQSHPRAEGSSHPQRAGGGGGPPYPARPPRPPRPEKQRKPLIDEATRYKPKAIRSSAALIWAQAEFPIPPPKDVLEGVRRVDLAGSGITDVSWLAGTGVTWLNLAGCQIKDGWESVGTLTELSVLNISNCSLKELPQSLSGLKNLKALVAMNNEWTSINGDVLSSWKDLNSLIASHSPSLTTLPSSLAQLHHLSKLTFSHCPKLTSSSLPDLSPLPVLRDVKMNNLPLLTSLPAHIVTWGTGDLSLTRKAKADDESDAESSTGPTRKGEGLEGLDLGNCSLPYTAIEPLFLKSKAQKWAQLRSLTLHSNPLGTTHPNYSDLLQASSSLPNLQIIDAKRIIERKRKGEVSESKKERTARERREGKMKPSGANDIGVKKEMRKWGGEEGEKAAVPEQKEEKKVKKRKAPEDDGGEAGEKKVKVKKVKSVGERKSKSDKSEKTAEKRKSSAATPTQPQDPAPADPSLDPSIVAPSRKTNVPAKEPVFEVVDVAKANAAKGEKVSRLDRRLKERKDKKEGREPVKKDEPVDLKSIFGAKTDNNDNDDSGLGVGGW